MAVSSGPFYLVARQLYIIVTGENLGPVTSYIDHTLLQLGTELTT